LSQLHEKVDRMRGPSDHSESHRRSFSNESFSDLESRIVEVLRDYGELKASARSRDAKKGELEDKLEALREKNAELVSSKIELMEKCAAAIERGADDAHELRSIKDKAGQKDEVIEERDDLRLKLKAAEERSAQLEAALSEATSAQSQAETALSEADAAKDLASTKTSELQRAADFLEGRAADAEQKAHAVGQDLAAALAAKDDADIRARDAEAQLSLMQADLERARADLARKQTELDDALSQNAKAINDSPKQEDSEAAAKIKADEKAALVKALMNDTYKQLYAHFAGGNDVSFTGTDVTRALKSVLKSITNQHLQ